MINTITNSLATALKTITQIKRVEEKKRIFFEIKNGRVFSNMLSRTETPCVNIITGDISSIQYHRSSDSVIRQYINVYIYFFDWGVGNDIDNAVNTIEELIYKKVLGDPTLSNSCIHCILVNDEKTQGAIEQLEIVKMVYEVTYQKGV